MGMWSSKYGADEAQLSGRRAKARCITREAEYLESSRNLCDKRVIGTPARKTGSESIQR